MKRCERGAGDEERVEVKEKKERASYGERDEKVEGRT